MIRLAFFILFFFFASLFPGAEEPLAGNPQTSPLEGANHTVPAETGETNSPGLADFIPVLSLYETALAGEVSWRPDWPLSVPPDAFSFPDTDVSAITLIKNGGDPAEELTIRRNDEGLLREFPLFRNGMAFQVQTRFTGSALIRGFTVASEMPWDILIVEYEEAFPSLARITRGEAVYFVMIEYAVFRAVEIWYDQEGIALTVFSFQYEAPGGRIMCITSIDLAGGEEITETYHYNGTGNISGILSSTGEYSALYTGEAKPRYWEHFFPAVSALSPVPGASQTPADEGQPVSSGEASAMYGAPSSREAVPPPVTPDFGHCSFQWDEEGLLTRFAGIYRVKTSAQSPEAQKVMGGGDSVIESGLAETDVRYEYLRDGWGNWIERRDTPMTLRSGFLVPGPVERIFRRIEYAAP
jgi:hypothetical protein